MRMRELRLIILIMCVSVYSNAQYTWDGLAYCNPLICNDSGGLTANTCAVVSASSFSVPDFAGSTCVTGWNNQVTSTQSVLTDGQKYCFEVSGINNNNVALMVGIDEFGGTTNWSQIDYKFYLLQAAPSAIVYVYAGTTNVGTLMLGNIGDLNGLRLCIEIVGNNKIFSIDGGMEITLAGSATASYFLQSNIYRAGSYSSPVTISNITICE